MKIADNTDFHWRNYLKPTPPNIYWLMTTAEAVVFAVNVKEIFDEVSPWMITGLLILQTIINKVKDFVGKIKDEYEKKIETVVKSETPITVETTTESTEN